MSEIEIRNDEREQCAKLVEKLAADKRKLATSMLPQRAAVFEEIADQLRRAAMHIRERESI